MSWKTALDATMEALVVPSFTRAGFQIRSRLFDWQPLTCFDLTGRVIVLTGATSGLGLAAAKVLASMGATLVMVARDPDKSAKVVSELSEAHPASTVSAEIADLIDLDQVRAVSDRIVQRHARIDVLIHNAGALFNERREAADGTEATCQLMVVSPFLMTALLLDQVKSAAPGRVITMSSGGMYTAPLTVADLEMSKENYSGTKQYARAKRAQVVLNEMWAERVSAETTVFHALHPGWADTPGVAGALPGFRRIVGPLLRTPLEGADTMVWLAAEPRVANVTGAFWLDRAVRSTHKLQSTKDSDTEEARQALWDWCVERSGVSVAESRARYRND